MLTELNVSQFAIIENLQIHFHDGLNIISGETGAGKSVLLKSLGLLMGAKSSSDLIRTGAPHATVEGHFELERRPDIQKKLCELDIPHEDSILVVRRLIGQNDKNKVYLNGTLSTVSVLKEIVAPMIEVAGKTVPLIEMTGQHENRNLLNKTYQLDLLDHSGGLWNLRKSYEKKWQEWKTLKDTLMNKIAQEPLQEQKLDFLVFQRDEIKKLQMEPGEEVTLENKIKQLKNRQKSEQFIDVVENLLIEAEDSALHRMQTVLHKSHEMVNLGPAIKDQISQLEQAKNLMEDFVYSIRKDFERAVEDADDLESLESKFSFFRKLQKKYGTTVEEILQLQSKIESEIFEIQNYAEDLEKLRKQESVIQLQLKQMGDELHELRLKHSRKLQKNVNLQLDDLNMKGCQFKVSVSKNSDFTPTGLSEVEFLSQSSSQDEAKALAKIASGGELSRILLSLKCVTGTSTHPRSYLFDEVDTGVSGPTAQKVGAKLHQIAKGQQVICVTHLPQVAAFADHHFLIQKEVSSQSRVHMSVVLLNRDSRIKELARLISGEKITKTSLAHAKELLNLRMS